MSEASDSQEPGVITPSEPAQEPAETSDAGGEFGSGIEPVQTGEQEVAQEDYGNAWPEETLGAAQELEDGAHFPDQGFDEIGAAFDGLGEDFDGIDWLEEDQAAPVFNSQQEFDQAVEERVLGVMEPYAYQQEMNALRDQFTALEQNYPDITEYGERIASTLEARAEQYGVDPEAVLTDPALVEAVYKGLKAEEAAPAQEDRGEALANTLTEMAQAPGSKDAFDSGDPFVG